MKRKVLVTGATGFVGNYVVNELLLNNFEVIASSSSPEKAATCEWFNKVRYIPLNINKCSSNVNYYRYFEEPGIVIHLAWEGLPNYKEAFHINKNLPLQKVFLENLLRNGLKDLVVTGTCFEYGMKEGPLSENIPAEPANPYAVAKNELRVALEELTAAYHCNFKWIRLFYMYGRGQSPKSLFSQLEKALENNEPVFNMSGGEQERDFLPVEKVATYIVKIATQQSITGIINCCSGRPVKVKDLVQEFLVSKNKNIQLNLGYYPYADYEPMRFWGDDTKLKTIINE